MRIAIRAFLALGLLALCGAAYFFLQLITGTPDVADVIVFPIYIGFSVIIAGACLIITLVLYRVRRRK